MSMVNLSRLDCVNEELVAWKYCPTSLGWISGELKHIQRALISPDGYSRLEIEIHVTNWSLIVSLSNGHSSQKLRYSYGSLLSICPFNHVGKIGGSLHLRFDDGFHIQLDTLRPHLRAIELWENISKMLLTSFELTGDLQKGIDLVQAIKVDDLEQPFDFEPTIESGNKFFKYFIYCVSRPPSLDVAYIRIKSPQAFKKLENKSVSTSASILSGDVYSDTRRFMDVVLPRIHGDSYSGHIHSWHMSQGYRLKKGDALFSLQWCGKTVHVRSSYDGILERILTPINGSVVSGQRVAVIRIASESVVKDTLPNQALSKSITGSISLKGQSRSLSTAAAINAGRLNAVAGDTPEFQPSAASIPKGFESAGSHEADLRLCLANSALDIQSFFNDLNIFGDQKSIFVNDDIVSIPCFDEGLYCNIVKQMHRYTLAEMADNKDQLAKDNAGLGAMVGSLVGLMTNNIFAPFLGYSLGKNLTDQTSKISEFLPDPHLLFYQDTNSYLSWSRAQVSSPKLRRLILDRQTKPDGTVFFRAIPAIVTADSVFPIQLFKCGNSTYFYRPFSAGIERSQVNYDATKIQKKYFHTRHMGESSKLDLMIAIRGNDVEPSEQNIYRFVGPSNDYFYLDFQIQPGSVF